MVFMLVIPVSSTTSYKILLYTTAGRLCWWLVRTASAVKFTSLKRHCAPRVPAVREVGRCQNS